MARLAIVEDEPVIRMLLSDVLRDEGYDVVEAGTLLQARQRVTAQIDLVLLDLRLPDGSGLDLLAELKEAVHAPVVLVMSGHGTVAVTDEVKRLGADGFLHKPFDVDAVVEQIARLLRHRARAEVEEPDAGSRSAHDL